MTVFSRIDVSLAFFGDLPLLLRNSSTFFLFLFKRVATTASASIRRRIASSLRCNPTLSDISASIHRYSSSSSSNEKLLLFQPQFVDDLLLLVLAIQHFLLRQPQFINILVQASSSCSPQFVDDLPLIVVATQQFLLL
jgi:hypothetical protein